MRSINTFTGWHILKFEFLTLKACDHGMDQRMGVDNIPTQKFTEVI